MLLCGTGIGFKACGLEVQEPVKGIVALYPTLDMSNPFWNIKRRPVSYFERVIPEEEVEEYLDLHEPKICNTPLEYDAPRNVIYHYMIHEVILQSLLLDQTSIPPESFGIAPSLKFKQYRTPPKYIVHETADRMIPMSQARDVVQAYKDIGPEVKYYEIEGANRSYDSDLRYGVDDMHEFILRCSGRRGI